MLLTSRARVVGILTLWLMLATVGAGGALASGSSAGVASELICPMVQGVDPGCFQPDARISKLHRPTHAWVGGGVFNRTGKNQARSRTVMPAKTVGFAIRIQNVGQVPGSASIVSAFDPTASSVSPSCAAYDADTPGFHVRYFHGPDEITEQIIQRPLQDARVGPWGVVPVQGARARDRARHHPAPRSGAW